MRAGLKRSAVYSQTTGHTLTRCIAGWFGGKSVRRQSSKEDSPLRPRKLFGCHLFPSQVLAESTLKCAMCISFKLQRIGTPASTTQSAPKEAAAWPKLCLYPCRTAPRILPTWDWPLDDQLPKRCPSPQNPRVLAVTQDPEANACD